MYLTKKEIVESSGIRTTPRSMNWFRDVCEFHDVLKNQMVATKVTILTPEEYQNRMMLIEEEDNELIDAIYTIIEAIDPYTWGDSNGAPTPRQPTLEEIAKVMDALVDSIYVRLGLAARMGLPIHLGWEEIHRSNMAKFPNGIAIVNEHQKVQKPAGWTPPDLVTLLDIWNNRNNLNG